MIGQLKFFPTFEHSPKDPRELSANENVVKWPQGVGAGSWHTIFPLGAGENENFPLAPLQKTVLIDGSNPATSQETAQVSNFPVFSQLIDPTEPSAKSYFGPRFPQFVSFGSAQLKTAFDGIIFVFEPFF